MVEEIIVRTNKIADENNAILKGYLKLGRGTNCLLFAHYCSDELFYKRFIKVSKDIFKVTKISNKNIKEIKKLLKENGYKKIWSRGVFSFWGDLRPLAVEAGFGVYGEKGLIHNEKYGSNFLITAVFFE